MYMETITGDRNKKICVYRSWPVSSHVASSVTAQSSIQVIIQDLWAPVTHLPCEVRNPLSHCPDRVLHVALRVTGHCLHSCPGEIHHRQIIKSIWRQETANPWSHSSLRRWSMTPDRPLSTRFRNSFICLVPGTKASRDSSRQWRQCIPRMSRWLCAAGGCLSIFCRVYRVLVAQNGGDCWQLTPLRPFPCSPVLFHFCSFPINSSIKFIWKGRGSLLPLQRLFQYCIPGGI